MSKMPRFPTSGEAAKQTCGRPVVAPPAATTTTTATAAHQRIETAPRNGDNNNESPPEDDHCVVLKAIAPLEITSDLSEYCSMLEGFDSDNIGKIASDSTIRPDDVVRKEAAAKKKKTTTTPVAARELLRPEATPIKKRKHNLVFEDYARNEDNDHLLPSPSKLPKASAITQHPHDVQTLSRHVPPMPANNKLWDTPHAPAQPPKCSTESTSDFPISSTSDIPMGSERMPVRRQQLLKNTLPADSFERGLSLIAQNSRWSVEEKIDSWQCSDELSDVEDVNNFDETFRQYEEQRKQELRTRPKFSGHGKDVLPPLQDTSLPLADSRSGDFSQFRMRMIKQLYSPPHPNWRNPADGSQASPANADKPSKSKIAAQFANKRHLLAAAEAETRARHQQMQKMERAQQSTTPPATSSSGSVERAEQYFPGHGRPGDKAPLYSTTSDDTQEMAKKNAIAGGSNKEEPSPSAALKPPPKEAEVAEPPPRPPAHPLRGPCETPETSQDGAPTTGQPGQQPAPLARLAESQPKPKLSPAAISAKPEASLIKISLNFRDEKKTLHLKKLSQELFKTPSLGMPEDNSQEQPTTVGQQVQQKQQVPQVQQKQQQQIQQVQQIQKQHVQQIQQQHVQQIQQQHVQHIQVQQIQQIQQVQQIHQMQQIQQQVPQIQQQPKRESSAEPPTKSEPLEDRPSQATLTLSVSSVTMQPTIKGSPAASPADGTEFHEQHEFCNYLGLTGMSTVNAFATAVAELANCNLARRSLRVRRLQQQEKERNSRQSEDPPNVCKDTERRQGGRDSAPAMLCHDDCKMSTMTTATTASSVLTTTGDEPDPETSTGAPKLSDPLSLPRRTLMPAKKLPEIKIVAQIDSDNKAKAPARNPAERWGNLRPQHLKANGQASQPPHQRYGKPLKLSPVTESPSAVTIIERRLPASQPPKDCSCFPVDAIPPNPYASPKKRRVVPPPPLTQSPRATSHLDELQLVQHKFQKFLHDSRRSKPSIYIVQSLGSIHATVQPTDTSRPQQPADPVSIRPPPRKVVIASKATTTADKQVSKPQRRPSARAKSPREEGGANKVGPKEPAESKPPPKSPGESKPPPKSPAKPTEAAISSPAAKPKTRQEAAVLAKSSPKHRPTTRSTSPAKKRLKLRPPRKTHTRSATTPPAEMNPLLHGPGNIDLDEAKRSRSRRRATPTKKKLRKLLTRSSRHLAKRQLRSAANKTTIFVTKLKSILKTDAKKAAAAASTEDRGTTMSDDAVAPQFKYDVVYGRQEVASFISDTPMGVMEQPSSSKHTQTESNRSLRRRKEVAHDTRKHVQRLKEAAEARSLAANVLNLSKKRLIQKDKTPRPQANEDTKTTQDKATTIQDDGVAIKGARVSARGASTPIRVTIVNTKVASATKKEVSDPTKGVATKGSTSTPNGANMPAKLSSPTPKGAGTPTKGAGNPTKGSNATQRLANVTHATQKAKVATPSPKQSPAKKAAGKKDLKPQHNNNILRASGATLVPTAEVLNGIESTDSLVHQQPRKSVRLAGGNTIDPISDSTDEPEDSATEHLPAAPTAFSSPPRVTTKEIGIQVFNPVMPKRIHYLTPPHLPWHNPLKVEYGSVLHVYFELDVLIAVQEYVVSFWRYSNFINAIARHPQPMAAEGKLPQLPVFMKPAEEQVAGETSEWLFLGECKRLCLDREIRSSFSNRICVNNSIPVYVEMRCREVPRGQRECNLLSMYINIYYFHDDEMAAKIHSIQLDAVQSAPDNVVFTTIPDSRYFIMAWPQENLLGKVRSGLCKYSLTPQMDTLASIREFKSLRHELLYLECTGDDKLLGFGASQLTIWDHRSGDVLMNYDLELKLGRNIGSVYYPGMETGQNSMIVLYQFLAGDELCAGGHSELLVIGCTISHSQPTHRVLRRHKLPQPQFDELRDAIVTAEHLVVTGRGSEEIWLSLANPSALTCVPAQNTRRFYTRGRTQLIELTNDTMALDTMANHVLKLAAGGGGRRPSK